MGIWDHYPAMKRRWRRRRCVCGVLLWRCADWNQRVNKQRRGLGVSEVTT